MSTPNPNEERPLTIRRRLAKLEKRVNSIDEQVVDSWATRTRVEYEKEFKAEVKERLIGFATVFLLGAVLFLAGAGYVILKAVVNESVNATVSAKYQGAIDEMKKGFDDQYQKHISWQTDHNTGVGRRQLAEFYFRVSTDDNPKEASVRNMRDLLEKAKQSFTKAVKFDKEQASSHWELGELAYTYPKRFGLLDLIDKETALTNYKEALKHFTEYDRLRGWKAQCYYAIGSIYADFVKEPTQRHPAKSSKDEAIKNLEAAVTEYDEKCKTCDADADQAKSKAEARILLERLKKSE